MALSIVPLISCAVEDKRCSQNIYTRSENENGESVSFSKDDMHLDQER